VKAPLSVLLVVSLCGVKLADFADRPANTCWSTGVAAAGSVVRRAAVAASWRLSASANCRSMAEDPGALLLVQAANRPVTATTTAHSASARWWAGTVRCVLAAGLGAVVGAVRIRSRQTEHPADVEDSIELYAISLRYDCR